ncbi:MAG: pyridoxal-phosphate dependent enzyme [Streptosporangiaceae bacterium]
MFCHAYDQPEICAGQGTLGLELLAQTGGVDTILVAVGGGGLMAGIAQACFGEARVVGVEPAGIPTLHAALAAGRPVEVPVSGIAADSLGASRLGEIAFDVSGRGCGRSWSATTTSSRPARSCGTTGGSRSSTVRPPLWPPSCRAPTVPTRANASP